MNHNIRARELFSYPQNINNNLNFDLFFELTILQQAYRQQT